MGDEVSWMLVVIYSAKDNCESAKVGGFVGGSKVTAARMRRERTEWCRRVRRVRDGSRHALVLE